MIFLPEPSKPDHGSMNRLSLNAHMDQRDQCGLLPMNHATLFESMTGRQRWGGYERCTTRSPLTSAPPDCAACPVQREHLTGRTLAWPSRTPVLRARVVPLPADPDALFADHAAGRSTVELTPLWGGPPTRVTWRELRNARGTGMTWRYRDHKGYEAFWLLRDHPDRDRATVRTKAYRSHTRHALYGPDSTDRAALVICHGPCLHERWQLAQLAADLTLPAPPSDIPTLPTAVPGAPGTRIEHAGPGSSTLHRHARSTRFAWDTSRTAATDVALTAYTLQLSACT